MSTGRRLIINEDNGGYAVFKTRNWGERDNKSDRKKGIRKKIGKILRARLKRSNNSVINEELSDKL